MSAGIGTVGFVGLGNMGSALAGNLVKWGLPVVAHDAAGPERSPAGAAWAGSLAELARRADLVVLSLPDGSASESRETNNDVARVVLMHFQKVTIIGSRMNQIEHVVRLIG